MKIVKKHQKFKNANQHIYQVPNNFNKAIYQQLKVSKLNKKINQMIQNSSN
jgi:hypothetical protein